MQNDFYLVRGRSIEGLIQMQGLKRYWVAEQVGVHRTTLQRWINGRLERVSRCHIDKLAAVLSTPTNNIIVGHDQLI